MVTDENPQYDHVQTFGGALRRHRMAARFTQDELAERAGLSRNAISVLERGERQRPHPHTVRQLVAALGLTGDEANAFIAASPSRAGITSDAAAATVLALPVLASTPLLGRDAAIAGILDLLADPNLRMLTLVGPGGVGKTRLALAVIDAMKRDTSVRATVVPLAAISNRASVLPAILEALGGHAQPGGTLIDALATVIALDRHLLVLDNLEHLIEIGTDLARLLQRCSTLRILTTSRSSLNLHSERVFAVPPLPVPDPSSPAIPADLVSSAAVQLFIDRARLTVADFELTTDNAQAVVGICAHLDGLPLAIELAAARLVLLPPAALLARLESSLSILSDGPRDAPARHRTMHDMIGWSYDLLDQDERTLFQRLAIFPGGVSLEAVRAICSDPLSPEPADDADDIMILRGLASLIDKSLLRPLPTNDAEPRVWMLRTIRGFAFGRLLTSGDEPVLRRRQVAYMLRVVEAASAAYSGPENERWIRQMDQERTNVEMAVAWAYEHGEIEIGLRLMVGSYPFLYLGGHITVCRQWMERLLQNGTDWERDTPPERMQSTLYAKAYRITGAVVRAQGDLKASTHWLDRSRSVAQAIGDRAALAVALLELAGTASESGDFRGAEILYAQSEEHLRAVGDERGVAIALANQAVLANRMGNLDHATALHLESLVSVRGLGAGHERETLSFQCNFADTLVLQGLLDQAAAMYQDCLDAATALGDVLIGAQSIHGFAEIARLRGNDDKAIENYGNALERYRLLGSVQNLIPILIGMAQSYCLLNEPVLASACAGEALDLARSNGDRHLLVAALTGFAEITARGGGSPLSRHLLAEALEVLQSVRAVVLLTGTLDAVAAFAARSGLHERSISLYAASSARREQQGMAISVMARLERDRNLLPALARLSPTAVEAAWRSGEVLDDDHAIAFALECLNTEPPPTEA